MDPEILSTRDIEFLLYEWLDIESLTAHERYAEHDRSTFEGVLDLASRLATDYFAPHNKLSDSHEPKFDGERVHIIPEVGKALQAYAASGLFSASWEPRHGGMQLPWTVISACTAWLQAANIATASYPLLSFGNANLILTHGSAEQIDTYVQPMAEGRFLGTMCLSEPHAGSSLADVTTRAVPQDDGTYRLFGTKMWISGGDHELSENIVHLVLARISDGPAGVRGISLFIVPKYLVADGAAIGERNDVVLAGLNHKMGWRGTTNAVLNFGEGVHTPQAQPGAIGYLVGQPHKGLAYMFHMMNEARIAVGSGAAALGYTGYLKSLNYARHRLQGRPVASKDPHVAQVPIIDHTDVRRMLLAQKAYAEGALALVLYASHLVDEVATAQTDSARDEAQLVLDTLTPIVKSWPSQWCLVANDLAIQIHGGAGYTRDYDVEQHYRDNRLNPIHEGTHGIQAMDLLGRKVTAKGGAGLSALLSRLLATTEQADHFGGELADYGTQLAATAQRIVEVTATLWGSLDPESALSNASVYLEAVGHTVVAWIWLQQALVAAHNPSEDGFYRGKIQAAHYFFRWELPKVGPQLDLLASGDRTTSEMRSEWF
ncbi:acyl-CoA dehydrogenase [Nocardia salmonicida]|uniref:acyl-CoA dehydrogenase n=1 Tax=Nocardia salmonicida TaxID=53431 RepID=UPI00366B7471